MGKFKDLITDIEVRFKANSTKFDELQPPVYSLIQVLKYLELSGLETVDSKNSLFEYNQTLDLTGN